MPTIPLYIFAGQSNMHGVHGGTPPAIENVHMYNSGDPLIDLKTGPEYGFADAMQHYGQGEMAIVRTAVGGRTIRAVDDLLDWSPNSRNEVYDLLLQSVSDAVKDLQAKGFTVEIKGVFWMQGEAEAGAMANAKAYASNLTDFLTTLRGDLGIPDLPVYLGEILHNVDRPTTSDIIRAQQQQVADTVTNVTLVTNRGVEQHDNVHFAESGLFQLGDGFARSLLGIDTSYATHTTGVTVNGTAGEDNLLTGTEANLVYAGDGDDMVYGEQGDDKIYGENGNDRLYGGTGNDTLSGGAGNDFLNGGDGDDSLVGGDGDDDIFGAWGNDLIQGGAGADILDGGAGADTASYSSSTAAVRVNLTTGKGAGGDAQGDTFISVEHLTGSAYADNLVGDDRSHNILNGNAGDDNLYGLAGNDTLRGGDGDDRLTGGTGADRLDGGAGTDLASYSDSTKGVNVNLTTGVGRSGDAEGDTLTNIENLYGSQFNDVLAGDKNDNVISGYDGNDHLYGYAGNDTLRGGAGNDMLFGGRGNDKLYGMDGADLFIFRADDFKGSTTPTLDIIKDFDKTDRIQLFGFDGDDVSAVLKGNMVTLTLHDTNHNAVGSINIESTQPTDLATILSKIDYL